VDLVYDVGGDRINATLSNPHTGLSHVEAVCYYSGGIAVAGDTSSGVGKSVKLVDANGIVRDLGFLGGDGYATAVGVVNMFSAGRVLICEVATEAGTETQWWYYFDGTWHASSPLQTKSSTISAIPLGWAENPININQQFRYRFFPRSSAFACARTFQPRNIFEDPIVNNTTQVKQDGPLFLYTPDLVVGPEEANKTFLQLHMLSRLVSATGGSYGTVTIDVDTAGDTTFATPDITKAFSTGLSGSSAPDVYNIPTSGEVFRTAMVKISLTNAASTAKTPNGLPFLFTMVHDWPVLSEWLLDVDVDQLIGKEGSIHALLTRIKTAAASQVSQNLTWGSISVPAVFEGIETTLGRIPPSGSAIREGDRVTCKFREVPGTV
jgi:hypothetical protein